MILQQNTGLVLEGGGMRGVFTAGVLDCFLDRKIYFPYAIGVSAGASNGLSYVSRQRGRARACDIDILQKYRYIGVLRGVLQLLHEFRDGDQQLPERKSGILLGAFGPTKVVNHLPGIEQPAVHQPNCTH